MLVVRDMQPRRMRKLRSYYIPAIFLAVIVILVVALVATVIADVEPRGGRNHASANKHGDTDLSDLHDG